MWKRIDTAEARVGERIDTGEARVRERIKLLKQGWGENCHTSAWE